MTRVRLQRIRVPPAVRIGLVLALIALAAWRLDLHALAARLAAITPAPALAALALLLAGQMVSGVRWRSIAARQSLHGPVRWFVAAYLRGCFYNAVLPTGIGGDAVRVGLCRRLGTTASGLRSVAFDRISGLVALGLTAVALIPLTPQLVTDPSARAAVIALDALVLAGLACGAVTRRLPEWMAWTLLYEAIWFAGVWLLAHALGVPIPPAAVPAVVLVVGVASALPVSIGGAGAREAAFVLVLAPLDVGASAAVALGIAFGVALTLVGLVGAAVRLPELHAIPAAGSSPLGLGAR